MQTKKILATAHAGCMNTRNDSLESVYAGISACADIVEVDVRFVQNQIPVLSHDPFKPPQVEHLVKLEEVLHVIKTYPNVTLNLDMKEVNGAKHLFRLLHKTDMCERVFFTGLEPGFIPVIQQECTGIPYLVNYTPNVLKLKDVNYLNELVCMVDSCKAVGINLHYRFVTQLLVEVFREANKKVYVWTVDKEKDIGGMIQLGVDSITSNRVDLLVKAIREAE